MTFVKIWNLINQNNFNFNHILLNCLILYKTVNKTILNTNITNDKYLNYFNTMFSIFKYKLNSIK